MSLIGYGRVSTTDQNTDAQIDALREAGCGRVFIEKASGKLARRPELDAALDYMRPGDVLVITKLDRLGRSVAHLVELAALLAEREIDLRVLHQGIDTTTPGGRLTFHIMASIAEFQRDLISERTRDGLQAARARGRTGGRPAALSAAKAEHARKLRDSGEYTMAEIAELVGCSRATLYRVLDKPDAATTSGTGAGGGSGETEVVVNGVVDAAWWDGPRKPAPAVHSLPPGRYDRHASKRVARVAEAARLEREARENGEGAS